MQFPIFFILMMVAVALFNLVAGKSFLHGNTLRLPVSFRGKAREARTVAHLVTDQRGARAWVGLVRSEPVWLVMDSESIRILSRVGHAIDVGVDVRGLQGVWIYGGTVRRTLQLQFAAGSVRFVLPAMTVRSARGLERDLRRFAINTRGRRGVRGWLTYVLTGEPK